MQTACDNYDDLVPQEYNCILSMQEYGDQQIVLYRTGEDTEYVITTLKSGNVPTSTANASVEIMNQAQFEEYCTYAGKSYKRLPDECYKLQDAELEYSASDLWKKALLAINYEKTEKYFNKDGESYVIPVVLTSETDSCLYSKRELMLKISDMIIPSIGFEDTLIEVDEDMIGDGTVTIEVPVVMPVSNLWDFTYEVTVDEPVLNDYNTANSENLALASNLAYSVNAANFVAGEDVAIITLTVDKSKLDWGAQAIPLRIKKCENENFVIDETTGTAVITLNKTILRSEMLDYSFTPTEDQIGGWGWATYQSVNDIWYIGYAWGSTIFDGLGKLALFDNDLTTHWHGDWKYGCNDPVYGQYIDFTLSEEKQHFMYDLWARYDNTNGGPKVTNIYGSTDGEFWFKLKTIKSALTAGAQKFESTVCSSATPFTHVRFAVVESNAGDVRVAGKFWSCAEMKLYVK